MMFKRFFPMPVFNAADGGGAGAPGAAVAAPDPAASATASSSSAAASPSSAGAGDPPSSPSADNPPAGAAGAPAGDGFYRPEGLPDHLVGKDANETMDKLYGALKGYRERDAQRGVADKVEAYGEFTGEIDDKIKPHVETLKADPLFNRVAERAMKHGITVSAYQDLVKDFISASGEMGLLEPLVDVEAERTALVPEAAAHLPAAEQRQAVERRMNENFAFLDALVTKGVDKGGLSKDDAEFAKAMLGDSAKGHRVFEWMRATAGGAGGNGPSLGGSSPGAQNGREELARRAALPENTWGSPTFNRASYEQLMADRRKFFGE